MPVDAQGIVPVIPNRGPLSTDGRANKISPPAKTHLRHFEFALEAISNPFKTNFADFLNALGAVERYRNLKWLLIFIGYILHASEVFMCKALMGKAIVNYVLPLTRPPRLSGSRWRAR
jgi:hypothetical protein